MRWLFVCLLLWVVCLRVIERGVSCSFFEESGIVCAGVYVCVPLSVFVCMYIVCAWPLVWNTEVHSHSFIYSFNQVQFSVSPSLLGEAALTFTQFHHTILCIYHHKSQGVNLCMGVGEERERQRRETEREREAPVISHESESASVVDPEPGALQALAAYCNY